MGEEIEHPQVNLPRALFLSPFLVFAVNALFQWVLVSIVPPTALTALADASAPYAEGMRLAGVTGFPLVLLCVGIAFGGDFSTLNAGVAAPARYLYTMARDGILPSVFARVHPVFRTPYVAILALGALMLVLVGTGSITAIASLSLFATLSYYILGIAAAVGLRRRYPDRPRPYRAPGLRVGAPVSIALYLLLMTQLEITGIVVGLVWSALGLGLYRLWGRKAEPPCQMPAPPPMPTQDQQKRLDRQYRLWRTAVAAAVGLVLLLYAFSFFFAWR